MLQLARESGIDIPTLCHDPLLTSVGACRLCLVEEERSGKLLASCVTPIEPGMVIATASPRVLERRKVIVELMLASHPDTCMVCDKGNRCELRRVASAMGIGLVKLERLPQSATIEEVNPFIERDLSKCILCAKCIRADQELVVQGAIDYIDRGFVSRPATVGDVPLEKSECTFCGTCVALCPTGALMEKEKAYRGTTAKVVSTVCPFCGCGCNISLEVKDNCIVRARPGVESAVNRGALCVRGSYGYDFVHSPERLRHPLRRVNGSFEEISWEHALDLVAAELMRVKATHGPSSQAVLGSSKCTNEENYLLQRFARGVLGTNNVDNGSRLYNAATRVGLGWTLGMPRSTGALEDLERPGVILVIGANPAASAPVVGYAIKRAVRQKGAELLLVDPQKTELSSFARLWLRPRAGTDIALLNGLAKQIMADGLMDEEFVSRRTDNFAALCGTVAMHTPEYVERHTGIAAGQVCSAARLFARAEQASIVYGNGITQQANGADAVTALANLAMLTGNVGRRKGGVYALQRENNAQGACDMGALPDFLPGYQGLGESEAVKKFEERWGVPIPAEAGLTAVEMVEQARVGGVRAMYIVGENPALSFPNLALVREALAALDFLVVEDLFLTETAKLANVVLPAASFAEKEGTFTNFEGRVQIVRKAIEPLGLPDWQIILELARRMGFPMPFSSPEQVMDEVRELVSLYQGALHSDQDLQSASFLQTGRLYGGQFPLGFSRFSAVEYAPLNAARDEYPFTLLVGSILYQFGSRSRSSRASRLAKFQTEPFVEIGEADAGHVGIADGDKVDVIAPLGRVAATARIAQGAAPGTLFMPLSFAESPVSSLFGIALDPRSKTPSLKACAVRLERNGSHG